MAVKQLNPLADSYVNAGYANTNYGSNSIIRVGINVGECIGFITFSGIPSGKIISAYLKLYVSSINLGSAGNSCPIKVVTSSWSESTITWNNKPTTGGQYGTIDLSSTGWKTSADLKTLIEYWKSNSNYGLAIFKVTTSPDNISDCSSKESGSNIPILEITYTPSYRGFSGVSNPWIFFKDAYENNKKLWKGKKLLLPKDLGFSY